MVYFPQILLCPFMNTLTHLTFQAESTKTGIEGKPCCLKRLERRGYGGFSWGRSESQGHHAYHMAYCCILRYDIRNLLLRSNCSNNKKSRFIINNDCNKDNKDNDNILNGEH